MSPSATDNSFRVGDRRALIRPRSNLTRKQQEIINITEEQRLAMEAFAEKEIFGHRKIGEITQDAAIGSSETIDVIAGVQEQSGRSASAQALLNAICNQLAKNYGEQIIELVDVCAYRIVEEVHKPVRRELPQSLLARVLGQ
jgi:hypothetical protein